MDLLDFVDYRLAAYQGLSQPEPKLRARFAQRDDLGFIGFANGMRVAVLSTVRILATDFLGTPPSRAANDFPDGLDELSRKDVRAIEGHRFF
ncbi:MAG: hypothetical protein IIB09_08205 [Bacteroidetes bacterium]|nr:hypothetical protein [Bacteroidota bacterium]